MTLLDIKYNSLMIDIYEIFICEFTNLFKVKG